MRKILVLTLTLSILLVGAFSAVAWEFELDSRFEYPLNREDGFVPSNQYDGIPDGYTFLNADIQVNGASVGPFPANFKLNAPWLGNVIDDFAVPTFGYRDVRLETGGSFNFFHLPELRAEGYLLVLGNNMSTYDAKYETTEGFSIGGKLVNEDWLEWLGVTTRWFRQEFKGKYTTGIDAGYIDALAYLDNRTAIGGPFYSYDYFAGIGAGLDRLERYYHVEGAINRFSIGLEAEHDFGFFGPEWTKQISGKLGASYTPTLTRMQEEETALVWSGPYHSKTLAPAWKKETYDMDWGAGAVNAGLKGDVVKFKKGGALSVETMYTGAFGHKAEGERFKLENDFSHFIGAGISISF